VSIDGALAWGFAVLASAVYAGLYLLDLVNIHGKHTITVHDRFKAGRCHTMGA